MGDSSRHTECATVRYLGGPHAERPGVWMITISGIEPQISIDTLTGMRCE